ncbi:MAG: Peptidyl-tRNA hydrolase [Candidatus Woesebacteria bacterium GW2011_GWB1_38_5]|uniref:Peptidyl-tRNA hydrolase n=4 Tax=Candidatus Woeseibacteriota TaxID=1752722 RepID=A0A0G0KIF6_9BACT|nr:MAG: Peptidyl-tRNA hydrolase [Candidatus Woesebacteria bacterium GW2011_GWD1_38_10]KKQ55613.1 MAG: Peptidyl-tRNA hydrolase [Candidatus Woesebacteria bacterium GW2011_GWC1_38_13]KKQ75295.1 MAG: Peptidyl-tRNA hydrolase [Candidatus Woesebacteria bacterium GW2011_GWB1_38_5]KKQ83950.1 MAG: Peptidyl-tRNA hydrolase [Candidatus Woesebacteria bacterium GW2011_GWA1_38_8]
MKLIVGLGNPGDKYKDNRHNVGFVAIDRLAEGMNANSWKKNEKFNAFITSRDPLALLVKPLSYMNESGKVVKKIFNFFKIKNVGNIIVIHDDLDLGLGKFKIQEGHGPELHNGIISIEREFKSEWFTRVRVGIDNRDSENRMSGERYVLENFKGDEMVILNETIEKITKDLIDMLSK